MESELLESKSLWHATAQMPVYPPLSANVTAEVCVIGGGLGGLMTAYLLARQGVRVAVVEALGIGSGETGRTTAHIATPDDRYWQIEEKYGADAARLVAESFAAACDVIEMTARTEQIDCGFERLDGYLYSCSDHPEETLRKELEAAQRAGVDVTLDERVPVESIAKGPCLKFRNQGQFHPLRYLAGLATAIERRGGVIFSGTRVVEVEERDGGVVIGTATGKITADAAVVATNTPFNERFAIHTKQNAYQTYVVAALVKKGSLPRVLIWDDADPYHYVRLAPDVDAEHDLLIVGGADHKTGQEPDTESHYRDVETWLRGKFPDAGVLAYRWSGEVMEPLDGIAYLGRNPGSRNVYVITGDSGNGMSHATIGGILVSDLIMGRQNRWLALYDPARKPLKEALQFIREQSNVAAQYTKGVFAGEEPRVGELAPGEGAVIRQGLKKFAVYRDEEGALHSHSAKCPHLGCVVQWNGVEKTWDCPCHGSRFSAYGSVLHGPAISGLAAVEEEDWEELLEPNRPGERTRPEDRPK
jgi:glycine/D-amino acid oxidase-like deaminating enzyme/nitrite reductase/ring-hydroxylating ferredoxin subunit